LSLAVMRKTRSKHAHLRSMRLSGAILERYSNPSMRSVSIVVPNTSPQMRFSNTGFRLSLASTLALSAAVIDLCEASDAEDHFPSSPAVRSLGPEHWERTELRAVRGIRLSLRLAFLIDSGSCDG